MTAATKHSTVKSSVLIVALGSCACALALTHVIETMRPLPVDPISGMPPFVRGLSIIRGQPTPVVDLALLLGRSGELFGRFITLRTKDRQVALAVDGVLGIRELDSSLLHKLPPLLQGAPDEVITAVSRLDGQLLLVLQAGWVLSDEVWQTIRTREAS